MYSRLYEDIFVIYNTIIAYFIIYITYIYTYIAHYKL